MKMHANLMETTAAFVSHTRVAEEWELGEKEEEGDSERQGK